MSLQEVTTAVAADEPSPNVGKPRHALLQVRFQVCLLFLNAIAAEEEDESWYQQVIHQWFMDEGMLDWPTHFATTEKTSLFVVLQAWSTHPSARDEATRLRNQLWGHLTQYCLASPHAPVHLVLDYTSLCSSAAAAAQSTHPCVLTSSEMKDSKLKSRPSSLPTDGANDDDDDEEQQRIVTPMNPKSMIRFLHLVSPSASNLVHPPALPIPLTVHAFCKHHPPEPSSNTTYLHALLRACRRDHANWALQYAATGKPYVSVIDHT